MVPDCAASSSLQALLLEYFLALSVHADCSGSKTDCQTISAALCFPLALGNSQPRNCPRSSLHFQHDKKSYVLIRHGDTIFLLSSKLVDTSVISILCPRKRGHESIGLIFCMRPAEKVLKELTTYKDPWHKQKLRYYLKMPKKSWSKSHTDNTNWFIGNQF